MSTVAFLGLGAMGERMARRVLDAGHDLVVWNRTAAKADPLVAAGASAAPTPAAAAGDADVVLTMVADPTALVAVSEGADGFVGAMRPGATAVEMSTNGIASLRRLRDALATEVDLLDAPVLGSTPQAEAGTLQVFVGGPTAAFERCRPLLEAMGEPRHMGPLGAGAAMKLVANSTLPTTLAVLGEALALGEALGLDRATLLDVLGTTPIAPQAQRRAEALTTGEYPLHFRLALAGKDLDLVTEAGADAGVELRLSAAARTWVADAVAAGQGDDDYSTVVPYIAEAWRDHDRQL